MYNKSVRILIFSFENDVKAISKPFFFFLIYILKCVTKFSLNSVIFGVKTISGF